MQIFREEGFLGDFGVVFFLFSHRGEEVSWLGLRILN